MPPPASRVPPSRAAVFLGTALRRYTLTLRARPNSARAGPSRRVPPPMLLRPTFRGGPSRTAGATCRRPRCGVVPKTGGHDGKCRVPPARLTGSAGRRRRPRRGASHEQRAASILGRRAAALRAGGAGANSARARPRRGAMRQRCGRGGKYCPPLACPIGPAAEHCRQRRGASLPGGGRGWYARVPRRGVTR